MVRQTGSTVPLAILTLALLFSRAAFAASDEDGGRTAQPAQTQSEGDNHSYLPPWMQKQEVAGIATTPGAEAADPSNPAATQKALAPGQAQRPQHRYRNDSIFSGFRNLWR